MLRDPHTHSSSTRPANGASTATAAPKRGRKPKPLDVEGERIRLEREEFRRREVEAISRIDPACEVEGDAPVVWRVPNVAAVEQTGILISLPRSSGRGLTGSAIVAAAREYDGTGPRGGEPRQYVSVHTTFRDHGGHLRRTIGVAVHASELRAVGAALSAHADALERTIGNT